MRIPLLFILCAALVSCGDPVEEDETIGGGPEPDGEPNYVTVDHILIAVANKRMPHIKRTRAEARQLAYDLLAKIKAGGNWTALKAEHSDDPGRDGRGGGPYTMANDGYPPPPGGMKRRGKGGMVNAFGDVGFGLAVGEIGMADFHATDSPFGFHIIKRVK